MTRVLTYNILLGGKGRIDQLTQMLSFSQADVIGMVEATDPSVIEELAQRLDMHYHMSERGAHERDWQMAILSRLPIANTQLHTRPTIFIRKHLLEVSLQETKGTLFSIFVIHQPAGYRSREGSRQIRRTEIQEILTIMSGRQGTPHLLMGDFNSIAPGDPLHGSTIILNAIQEHKRDLRNHPEHQVRMSTYQRLGEYTISMMLHTKLGCRLIDQASQVYGRGGIDLLLQAGYTDTFRYMHSEAPGFTFPAAFPACRIDYIFVSSELTKRLTASSVITSAPSVNGDAASDHLPVYADFIA